MRRHSPTDNSMGRRSSVTAWFLPSSTSTRSRHVVPVPFRVAPGFRTTQNLRMALNLSRPIPTARRAGSPVVGSLSDWDPQTPQSPAMCPRRSGWSRAWQCRRGSAYSSDTTRPTGRRTSTRSFASGTNERGYDVSFNCRSSSRFMSRTTSWAVEFRARLSIS